MQLAPDDNVLDVVRRGMAGAVAFRAACLKAASSLGRFRRDVALRT